MKQLLLIMLCITLSTTFAKNEQRLIEGKQQIQLGAFKEAITPLKRVLQNSWDTKEGEEALVLLSEVYVRIDSISLAKEAIDNFITYYPDSRYIHRMSLLQGKIDIQEGLFYQGASKAMRVLFLEVGNYLYNEARTLMNQLLKAQVLHEEELLKLVNSNPVDNEVVGTMVFQLAQIYESKKKYTLARNYLQRIMQQFPGHSLTAKAEEKRNSLLSKGPGIESIIIVTPLSGDYAALGQFVVQGAILAIEKHNDRYPDAQVSYRVLDTKAHPAEAIEKVSQVMLEDNIAGVIGPVMSPTAAALGAWLSQKYPHVPLITPTATDAGIAGLGKNIFQINTSPSYLAQSIARFSVNCQKHKEYAVLVPDSDYGSIMAENFKEVVEKFGGTVLFEEYYEEGLADYRANYDVLRLKKFNLDRKRDFISGVRDTSEFDEDENQKWLLDSTISFDALFIAASDPEDASVLASQAYFNKVDADLLGSSGWYSKTILKKGKQYVENTHFSTSLVDHDKNREWEKFKGLYLKRWGVNPDKDRVSGLTYNATRFILWGIQKGGGNVVNKLRSAKTVKGVYGNMKFNSEKGYNDGRTILKIKGGKFYQARKCTNF
ncbi:MAG: penicillin-binding protein activator [Fibrobacterales bacterium]